MHLDVNLIDNPVRWSKRSCGEPGCDDPDCVCALCAQPLGTPDDLLVQNNHDPDCVGCSMCEDQVPIILFRGKGKDSEQAAFHQRCFEKILVK